MAIDILNLIKFIYRIAVDYWGPIPEWTQVERGKSETGGESGRRLL
jgi:hypothetical protein